MNGVNSQTGLYDFEDLDGNGMINADDQKFFQDRSRTFFGGISNSFSYKGFEATFLFQGGKQVIQKFPSYPGTFFQNMLKSQYDVRWQKPGDDAKYQRLTTSFTDFANMFNYRGSTGSFQDCMFLRLKTLGLSYHFKEQTLTRIHLHGIKVFIQGQNLFTYSEQEILDVETGNSAIPPLKILTAGINIKF
ncbi:MAG: hypothetical protein EOO43_10810 [Flavobacterium sp.]|nr:MAG: hypothetical protein EOO43_10810 [Flavobacterium sp.]